MHAAKESFMDAHCIGFHRNANNCNLITCIMHYVYCVQCCICEYNTVHCTDHKCTHRGRHGTFLLKYCIYCVSSPSLHRELVTHKVKESQTKICDIFLLPGCCFDAIQSFSGRIYTLLCSASKLQK